MTTKPPNENAIRDYLAERIDMIEPGLTLVDREYYLANPSGAAGFLDIFAHDSSGQLVIIEIKRTDAAAREAIQELYKYAALLRQKHLIRDLDYRLILLSVEWHELLTPYSEFKKRAPFDISAGRIVLGPDKFPMRIEPVSPVPTAAQRRFSTRHFLWRFEDEPTATAALPMIADHMRKVGLADFVLIRSRSNNPLISEKVFIYFAQQELSFGAYLDLIRGLLSDEEYAEFEEQISDLVEEEDRISEAADQVWLPGYDALFDRIDPDSSEISHPEKASHWFAEGARRDVVVERFGRFADDGLSDETIIKELIGHGGASDYHLRVSASTESRPQMEALRAGIANVFFFNSDWRGASLDLLAYAEKTGPAIVRLVAFSNEDILRSIAGAAFNYPGFVPTFRFDIERVGQSLERFIGLPEWDGKAPDFDLILTEHFGEDRFSYFMAHHFGGHRGINADIMADLGLRYAVFREGESGPERVRVQGSAIVVAPKSIKGSILSLIEANIEEVHKIVALYMEHDQGFAETIKAWINSEINVAERQIEGRIASLIPPNGEWYWSGKIELCNLCDRPFNGVQYMIDAPVRGGGANICAQCYLEEGGGRGTIFVSTREGWRMLGTDRQGG